jgi:glycosyltransferase involved in cell wall biosynthesis
LIAGRRPDAKVTALGRLDGVEMVGEVADVRPILERSAVVVAPLQIAPGMQNKVLEAMASSRAVVCSPDAARGIDAQVGKHLLVAENAGEYVEQLEELQTNHAYRQRMGRAAQQRVAELYVWDKVLAPMVDLLRGGPEHVELQAA